MFIQHRNLLAIPSLLTFPFPGIQITGLLFGETLISPPAAGSRVARPKVRKGDTMRHLRIPLGVICLGLLTTLCHAQSQELNLPRQSQRAVLTQRVGVTDITITYHRPLENGRKIWGGLVPYGQVWRAGANENTTVKFSDPVTVEGKPLAAGTYGMHMIPAENGDWTVIFSNMSTAWGSFSYKQDEDALRVSVKPGTADEHNALTYDFDQLKPDSAVLTMSWGKVAVPINIAVDVNKTVEASLQKQLRGLPQYDWQAWNDAANYFLSAKFDYEQGLKDVDQSIQNEERFDNYMTKSQLLDAMGKTTEAKAALDQALAKASAVQLYGYGRQLLKQDHKPQEAFAVFHQLINKYPDAWVSHLAQARLDTGDGKYDQAVSAIKLAYNGAPDNIKSQLDVLQKQLESKQDINK